MDKKNVTTQEEVVTSTAQIAIEQELEVDKEQPKIKKMLIAGGNSCGVIFEFREVSDE